MRLTLDKDWLKSGDFYISVYEIFHIENLPVRITYSLFDGDTESETAGDVSFILFSPPEPEVGWKERGSEK